MAANSDLQGRSILVTGAGGGLGAPAVRFLLSSDAAQITAEVLTVDGGFTAR
jgi:NAD(P)-dependent dehydrogenase (short-subunit alcohol dehydrogenase family)